jgi:hypothetical protein
MAKILEIAESKPLGWAGLNPSKTRKIHFYQPGTLGDVIATMESGMGWWKDYKPKRAAQIIREFLLPHCDINETVRFEVVPGTGRGGDGSFTIIFNREIPKMHGEKDGYRYSSLLGKEFRIDY